MAVKNSILFPKVIPEPAKFYQIIDLEGNAVVRIWFEEPTDQLLW